MKPQRKILRTSPQFNTLPQPLGPIDMDSASPDPATTNEEDIVIWFDGSANPNPGKGGYGIVVFIDKVCVHEEAVSLPGEMGNNFAEIYGLERALQIAVWMQGQPGLKGRPIHIRTDSKNVEGFWNGDMTPKATKAPWDRSEDLRRSAPLKGVPIDLRQVPEIDRAHCKRADELAKMATGGNP